MANAVDVDLLGECYPRWNRMLEQSGNPFDTIEWCSAQLKTELGIRRPPTPNAEDFQNAEHAMRSVYGGCGHTPNCPDRQTCLGKYAVRAMLRRLKPLRVRA